MSSSLGEWRSAFDDVALQAEMIADEGRTRAFAEALRRTIRKEDVVLDVGTGSGILAVVAARAGARRVIAVERGAVAELAETVIRQNGVADRVRVLRADARDVELPELPTVVVSETLGNVGFDEDIIGLMSTVAKRCHPDARLIPRSVRLGMAPAMSRSLTERLGNLTRVEGVDLTEVRARAANRVTGWKIRPEELLGTPSWCDAVSTAGELPQSFCAVLTTSHAGDVSAITAFFEADLGYGIAITNQPGSSTCWLNLRLPVWPPLPCQAGDELEVELEMRVTSPPGLYRWSVRHGDEERVGDEMLSSGGRTLADYAGQLGLIPKVRSERTASGTLDAWAAALSGTVSGSVEEMAERVQRANPKRYTSTRDARDEVLRLLKASDALE